jgi:hypothetical protein
MGVGRGANNPTLQKKLLRSLTKFSQILRRRPRPKLGCGAKERRRMFDIFVSISLTLSFRYSLVLFLRIWLVCILN